MAVVTGASRGLGHVIARRAGGARLRPGDRRREKRASERAADDAARLGRGSSPLTGDIADPASGPARRRGAAARRPASARQQRVGARRHRAARRRRRRPLAEHILRVNVVAPIALVQLARRCCGRTCGLIVNISSDAAPRRLSRLGRLRREQGRARADHADAGCGELRDRGGVSAVDRRSRRHAHAHAPGGLSAARTSPTARCPK